MKKRTALPLLQKLFHQFFWPLAIILITAFICVSNYMPGKWLTGWDTLHPEFNFPLHISRSIFGVWRQDQALGTVAAHSHMSELPRILVLWAMSAVLPLHFLRVGFIYLCFILGPLGIYYFIKNGILNNKSGYLSNVAAFLGALVYIFNLGTVQHFYVIFEMFAVQYAALGWLLLSALKVLYSRDKRNYLYFFLLSFFSAPMAYASQLWFAYFGALLLFSFMIVIQERKKSFVKQSFVIILLTLAANSFWLFPNLYFLLTDAAKVPANSQINKLFSPESFLHNANFGKIQDVAIFRNFLFNWLDLKADGKFGDLLPQWKSHLNNIWVLAIGYGVFIISILTMIWSVIKKKKVLIALLPIWLMALFMLMNMNPPFDLFFGWLREHVSLFKEGLRTPFTKFSLLLMFTVSVYFGAFFFELMSWIKKIGKPGVVINLLLGLVVSASLAVYGLPLLQGQLINKKLFRDIPQPYFSLYKWFDTQPEQARVINLPLQTSAGWEFFNWGYEGAGFVWFGMTQPLSVRDFDRWSPYNETLYKELSTALYGNDPETFRDTLIKYDVSFLLLDESIINPNKPEDSIKKPEIKALLDQLGLQPVWHEEFLSVYDVRKIVGSKPFVYSPQKYSLTEGDSTYSKSDVIFEQNGAYVSSSEYKSEIYPFAHYLKDEVSGLGYLENKITSSERISKGQGEYDLVIPPLAEHEKYTAQVNIKFEKNKLHVSFPNSIELGIGSDMVELPQLPALEMVLPSEFSTVVVEIGDRQTQVKNGAEVNMEATLTVNQSINVAGFNLEAVKEEHGKRIISENDITYGSLAASAWEPLTKETVISVKNPTEIRLAVNSYPYNQDLSNLKTATSCDPARKNGWFKKLSISEGVVYQTGNLGVACDGVDLSNLSQNGSYIIRWQTKNISGRGIKTYLQNLSTNRSDLEELIPKDETEVSYLIRSWKNVEDHGYYLSWENRSFGSEVSENLIKSIQIYPYPVDTISRIKLVPKNSLISASNQVEIKDLWKFGTHQYGLQATAKTENGLLVLSQGYEKGWIAFEFKGLIPSIFKKVKYKGWANAWMLPKGTHSITILYWPQLLEFIGLGVLVVCLFKVSTTWIHERKIFLSKKRLLEGRPLKITRIGLTGRQNH